MFRLSSQSLQRSMKTQALVVKKDPAPYPKELDDECEPNTLEIEADNRPVGCIEQEDYHLPDSMVECTMTPTEGDIFLEW